MGFFQLPPDDGDDEKDAPEFENIAAGTYACHVADIYLHDKKRGGSAIELKMVVDEPEPYDQKLGRFRNWRFSIFLTVTSADPSKTKYALARTQRQLSPLGLSVQWINELDCEVIEPLPYDNRTAVVQHFDIDPVLVKISIDPTKTKFQNEYEIVGFAPTLDYDNEIPF